VLSASVESCLSRDRGSFFWALPFDDVVGPSPLPTLWEASLKLQSQQFRFHGGTPPYQGLVYGKPELRSTALFTIPLCIAHKPIVSRECKPILS
jgi:hypothetical protein